MSPEIPMIVFSNVDEVLGRPTEWAFSDAAKTLKGLEREAVPLVLCSNKTRAEIEAVQQALDIYHPFVCEGGSAAFVPVGYFQFDVPEAREVAGYQAIELGRPYPEVVEALRRTASRQKIAVVGFNDMSVEEVARDCHLSLLEARLAKLREYGERFRVVDPDQETHQRLYKALEGAHLHCFGTERYPHVGAAIDTRLAASLLYALFRRAFGAVLSVGSSDATAPFSDRRPRLSPGARGHGTTLAGWAEAIMAAVGQLRDRESRHAR
jgi:predicted mannosyl-3-phosphoglycerate phosphatase (HAD superfamily)